MPAKYTKRPDGRYCTHVVVGVRADGKPLRKTVYAKTVRELEETAAEVRRQVSVGAVIVNEGTTVAEWAMEWLSAYKMGTSVKTSANYKILVNTHIIPFMGHMRLKDVKPYHVQRIINEKHAAGLTRTVQQLSMTLKQIFSKALENNLITKSPAASVKLPNIPKPRKRALTDAEMNSIDRADLDAKSRAFLYMMMYAGLRKGEALALMRKDINFTDNTVTVYKTLSKNGSRPEIKMSPKTEAGNRVIPMPVKLVSALKLLISETDSVYLFPSANGVLMSDTAFRRFWDKIKRRINMSMGGTSKIKALAPDVTPHMFRHTYATLLYYSGADIKAAQYLLGHASIDVTMEIYTHLDKKKNVEAVSKLDDFLSSSQKVVNPSFMALQSL